MSITGLSISTRVSSTAQYTAHLRGFTTPEFVSPMRVTFIAETDKPGDLEAYQNNLNEVISLFNGRLVCSMDNSLILHMLEPKDGHTIQTFLNNVILPTVKESMKRHMPQNIGYMQLGDEVPRPTKSELRMFITSNEPTLEFMCALVLLELPWAKEIRANADSGLSVRVSWEENKLLL